MAAPPDEFTEENKENLSKPELHNNRHIHTQNYATAMAADKDSQALFTAVFGLHFYHHKQNLQNLIKALSVF